MEPDEPEKTMEGNSGSASVLPQQLMLGSGLATSPTFFPCVLIRYIGGPHQPQPVILPQQQQPLILPQQPQPLILPQQPQPLILPLQQQPLVLPQQQEPPDQAKQTTRALPTTAPVPPTIINTSTIVQSLISPALPTPPQGSTEGGVGSDKVKLEPIVDLETRTITKTLVVERGIGNDEVELRPILDPHTPTVTETSAIGQPPLVSTALPTPSQSSAEGGVCNREVKLEPSLNLQVEVASSNNDTSTNPLAIGELHGEEQHLTIPDALERNLPDGFALNFSQDGSVYSGVRSEKVIPKGTKFGPCKGKIAPAPIGSVKDSTWEICILGACLYLDTQARGSTSSWMARIKCANYEEEQNMEAYQSYGDIFFQTTKSIEPGDQLKVFYGKEYAAKVGFRLTLKEIRTAYGKDTEDFHCLACDKAFSSSKSLLRHNKIDHKPDKVDKTRPDSTGKVSDATINQGNENSASLSSQRTGVNPNTLKASINDSPVLKIDLTRKASDAMETEENENLQRSSGQAPQVNAKPTNPVEAVINTFPAIDKGLTLEVSDASETEENENSRNSSSLVPQVNPVPVKVAINTLPNISAGSAIENEEDSTTPSRPVPQVNPNPVKLKLPDFNKGSFVKLLIVSNGLENKKDENSASLSTLPQVRPNPNHPVKTASGISQVAKNQTSKSRSKSRTKRYNSFQDKLDAYNCTCLRKSLPRGVKREVREISRKYCTCRLKCTVCGKSFKTRYNLSQHMVTHQAKQCICDVCGKAFRYWHQLNKHKKKSHAVTYSCGTCEMKFMVKREFIKHEKMHAYICGICEMKFTTKIDLMRHRKTHGKYGCEICDMTFTKKIDMKRHRKTHGKYGCETCGKRFFKKPEFYKHTQMHKREQRLEDDAEEMVVGPLAEDMLGKQENYFDYHRPYKCSYCPKSYVSKKGQLDHEAEKHTKQCPFKCEQCSNGFASKHRYMEHMKSHVKICLFQCSICSASFPSKSHLKYHEDEHAGLKSVKCEQCGKGFRNRSEMRRHVNRAHNVCKMKFTCPFCSKPLISKSAFKVHVQRHKGIRPFLCHECGCTFITNTSLKLHSYKHMKEKLFGCPKCDRKFNYRQNLTTHILKVHTSISEALGNPEQTNIDTLLDS